MPRQLTIQTTPRQRGPKQADLFAKFEHLNRQRRACQLAERMLRMLATVDDDTAEIAIQIASTAVQQKNGDDLLPAVKADLAKPPATLTD